MSYGDQIFIGSAWNKAGLITGVKSCILVIANAGGGKYSFGTLDVDVPIKQNGNLIHFVGAILNDPADEESIDIYNKSQSTKEFTFDVSGDQFPIPQLRKIGVVLQDVDVDIYWYLTGCGMSLDQAMLVMSGKLSNPTFDEEKNVASFSVREKKLEIGQPFPPIISSTALITNLNQEQQGKCYPVVIGTVSKVPTIFTNVARTNHLVMHDKFSEFSGSPCFFAQVYDGDVTLRGITGEGRDTDNAGNPYWRCTATASTSFNTSVDVIGHTPATIGSAIRFLLQFWGGDLNTFDLFSTYEVDAILQQITLGFSVNERVSDGVIGLVQNRLCVPYPLAMIQRAGKYSFVPIMWTNDVVRTLSFEHNIIKKVSGPTESNREQIYNSFTIRYGMTGNRGDFKGTLTRDWDSSTECKTSSILYGKRAMEIIDAPDVVDLTGASFLMNWLIETYTRMRVFISYECTFDVAIMKLLENARSIDTYENWDTNFKVIGVRRGTGSTIILDLVSILDYVDVYGINRT